LTFVAENLFGRPVFVKTSRLEGFEDERLKGFEEDEEGNIAEVDLAEDPTPCKRLERISDGATFLRPRWTFAGADDGTREDDGTETDDRTGAREESARGEEDERVCEGDKAVRSISLG